MNSRIGHLACRYRLVGNVGAVESYRSLLDDVFRRQVPDLLGEQMDAAFGNDPTVYVVRRVDVPVALQVAGDVTMREVGNRLGDRLAASIADTVARDPHDGGNVVHYPNQAEFVASFVCDLLHNRAWGCWYYGAFKTLREKPRPRALASVLLDNREHLAQILGSLQRSGTLDELIKALDERTLRQIWSDAFGRQLGHRRDTLRPLFSAAVAVAHTLQLWHGSRSHAESLLADFAAGRSRQVSWRDPVQLSQNVLDALAFLTKHGHLRVPTNRSQASIESQWDSVIGRFAWLDADVLRNGLRRMVNQLELGDGPFSKDNRQRWRQAFDLAVRIVDSLSDARVSATEIDVMFSEFVNWLGDKHRSGRLHDTGQPVACAVRFLGEREPFRNVRLNLGPSAHSTLRRLIAGNSTVDADRILSLLRCFAGASEGPTSDLPSRPVSPQSRTREEQLADDLLAVLRRVGSHLSLRRHRAAENSLRLYAMLVEHAPHWADDPLASRTIELLLAAAIERHRAPGADGDARRTTAESRTRASSPDESPPRDSALDSLRRVCGPAAELVDQLCGDAGSVTTDQEWYDSDCGGLMLLVRTILDVRLPGILARLDYPQDNGLSTLSAVLAALGLRWAGEGGVRDDRLDPAVALFAGLAADTTIDQVRGAWSDLPAAAHERFQTELLRLAAAQRMVRGDRMRLYYVADDETDPVLIAGDPESDCWPLGAVFENRIEATRTVDRWLTVWQETFGCRPVLEMDDRLPAGFFDNATRSRWSAVEAASDLRESADRGAGHASRAEERHPADVLTVLHDGRLGHPAADLTLGLAGACLLRFWARWLRQFARSSHEYLLTNFVRRPAQLYVDQQAVVVHCAWGGLEVALQMVGYADTIESVPWLDNRHLEYMGND